MRTSTYDVPENVSVSLASVLARRANVPGSMVRARAAGLANETSDENAPLLSVIVESESSADLAEDCDDLGPREEVRKLGDRFLSARVTTATLKKLARSGHVRIQSKKQSLPHLTHVHPEIGLVKGFGGQRVVSEDGSGVLVGVVDSGFDLSHPVFRDASGQLRVEALLDQTDGNKEFDTPQLQGSWSSGRGSGFDSDGHGTHVACIAGGSSFKGCEGIAPQSRLLLVKTDFENTDEAVSWIFRRAGATPCVVNLSFGHHFGAHDGTDAEERLHRSLVGPGKIIVASAGNEREQKLHIGGSFHPGLVHEVAFDLLQQRDGFPVVHTTLWYDREDDFSISLVRPDGTVFKQPPLDKAVTYSSALIEIEIARRLYVWSNAIQVQIAIVFKSPRFRTQDLQNWKLRLACNQAAIGRLDGWFHNSGFALFRDHPLGESHRTVGLPATGAGCITVASHVSRSTWDADLGPGEDTQILAGRSSSFSSLGPTRDGRWKPDISAPGQYVTAALADRSESSELEERASTGSRLLTIEGTSMSAPVVTGIVALMLQKKPALGIDEARDILAKTAQHDGHTGPATWTPTYGSGKANVAAALNQL